MKFIISLVLFLSIFSSLKAQGTNPIQDIEACNTERKELYGELRKKRTSPELWLRFYDASKKYITTVTDRSLRQQQLFLDTILTEMKTKIPNSFEYNFCEWNSVVLSAERASFLNTATKLQPNHPRVLVENLYVALMTNNDSLITLQSNLIYSKAIIPSQMMNFAYNTLVSTPSGSLLFVDSDKLFEAIIVLQFSKNIRRDVPVFNKKTLAENNNRTTLFAKTGLSAYSSMYNDISTTRSLSEPFHSTIVALLQYSKKTISFTSTFNSQLLSSLKDSLYVVGTVYQYSPIQIKNGKILLSIWNKLRLEYLRFDLYGEQFKDGEKIKKETYPIYISCATILYNYSKEQQDLNAMTLYRGFALSVAKQIGSYDDVEAYFLSLEKLESK